MGHEMSIPDTLLFTDTPIEDINRDAAIAYFRNLLVTRNGRNQSLLDSCQNGYVIQCAGPSYSSRRLMSFNDDTTIAETSTFTAGYFLAFAFIAMVLLIFMKIMKDKNNKINELEKELSRKNGNYGKQII